MQIPTLYQINKELAEREYYDFFLQAWPILEPTTPLDNNWHIKYLCDTLQLEIERIARGEKKTTDIIINIPPRSLKSTIVTIFLNAWAWSRWPHLKFIATSYGGDLAVELAAKTRRVIDSDWYRRNWLKTVRFSDDQNTKSRFENTAGGVRKSVGVGGALTGSGADCLIFDDPLNPQEAHSEAERNNCLTWFKETAYSRLNNQEVGLRIVIMQRLHEEDLTGYILANQPGKWRLFCLPASDEYHISPPELKAHYQDGLFFPTRFSRLVLEAAKQTLATYGYAGQMGQSPAPDGGGVIKLDWLKFYKTAPDIIQTFWSWDCAVKKGESNDFSVGVKLGEGEDHKYYVLDLLRGKWEYPELKRLIQVHGEQSGISGVLIEDKSSGQQLIQDLRRNTGLNILAFESDRDKIMRATLASPVMESGRLCIPENAPWLPDFMAELAYFPNGKHDDQVDALTQILLHLASYNRPAMALSGKDSKDFRSVFPVKKEWQTNQNWM